MHLYFEFVMSYLKTIWSKAKKYKQKEKIKKNPQYTAKWIYFFFEGPSKHSLLYAYMHFLSKPTPIPVGSSSIEIEHMGKDYI